jgi:hypothetical protein
VLGVARNYHHQIETDESPPIKMSFYRPPPHLQKETERQIEEMLDTARVLFMFMLTFTFVIVHGLL